MLLHADCIAPVANKCIPEENLSDLVNHCIDIADQFLFNDPGAYRCCLSCARLPIHKMSARKLHYQ